MSKSKSFLLLGIGITLLIATLLFSLSPMRSGTAYAAANTAITFANANWNCANISCTSKVSAGSAQPNYECAEFVARALATEGLMPGLTATSSQSAYGYYKPGNGKTYDLNLITPLSGYHTLADYLLDYGIGYSIGTSLSQALPGDMVVFEDRNHTPQHTVLIITVGSSTSTTKVDAHNNAEVNYALSNYLSEFPYYYIMHPSIGGGCGVKSGLAHQSMASHTPDIIPC